MTDKLINMTIEDAIQDIDGLVHAAMADYNIDDEEDEHDEEVLGMAVWAMKKQIPMKPIYNHRKYGWWDCPRCNYFIPEDFEIKYCQDCGQAIDWNEEERGMKDRLEDNVKRFKEVTEELTELYSEKNIRYNDSFSRQFEKSGLDMTVMRLDDKFSRLEALVKNPGDDGGDESIEDTLKDLANYAIMTLVAIRRAKS